MSTKVQTLRALNPARLAPGHGRVLESPTEAMDVVSDRAGRALGES